MEDNSEEESVGASSVNDTEAEESGGSSSENETEISGNKRLKLEEEGKDRISTLPDSLIHHILSFLPSTKEAIRTGILSKRWRNQWTRVPVLIFDSTGKNDKNFSQFIDNTLMLYDCSKIKKFHVQYDNWLGYEPHLTSKIRFATRKDVEELILHLDLQDEGGEDDLYTLPKFLFDNASLVKLELVKCFFDNDRRPNWSSLKELKLECSSLCGSDIEKVVSGSPVLELLELTRCIGFHNVVIASKSLKRLIFVDVESDVKSDKLEISCPNLEELSMKLSKDPDIGISGLPDETIENVLSRSHLLHTLELMDCVCSDRFVIASKSLKKLVLGEIWGTEDFEISCPDLVEVNLYHFVPSDFCTTGDFESKSQLKRPLAMKILGQLQHAKLLEIGSWFITILSALEVKGLSSPLLNCKCLTLDGTGFDKHLPGILCAIRSSPALEKLVIKLQLDQPGGPVNLKDYREKNSWNLNEALFKCSVSNLKTVKIIGLSERDGEQKLAFKFVEFLLENARVLDKIVVILANCGAGFPFDVSKRLLSFQRCFPHTTIELLSST